MAEYGNEDSEIYHQVEGLPSALYESLPEKNEAGSALDISWSSHAYEHKVFFSHLSLTFPGKTLEMKLYLTD